jgi:SOS-response transcriptional repressor LexA
MWPPIPDGAVLLVREVEDLKNGEKYVIETEDEQMTFKLIQFDKHGANLVPLNTAYSPIPLGEARLKRLYQVLAYKVDWT